jgi:hypothetical protein
VRLSGEQRYRQALIKAGIVARRELRRFLAGELDYLPGHRDREFIIAEIDRAYRAGVSDGKASSR